MTRAPGLEQEDLGDWSRLLGLVRRRWGSVLLVTAVTLAAALAYCLLARHTYESTAVVRVGQVGLVGPQGDPGRALIEPIARAAERLRTRQFQDSCLQAAHESAGEYDPVARLYRRSLAARVVPNTDLISLSVRGYSKETSRKLLQATVDTLAQVHAEIAAPAIQNLHSTALQLAQQVREARDDIERLRRLDQARGNLPPGSQFSESAYVAGSLSTRLETLGRLQERQIGLEEQLNPARTYPTSAVDPARVDPDRTTPRLARALMIALAAGLLLGLFLALLRESLAPSLEAAREAPQAMPRVRDERSV
jgi:uncharacterized protein involved in exopolysaccharide biosynthesis